MRNKLPVLIEDNSLPRDDLDNNIKKNNSYGYVSILYIMSLIITGISVIVVLGLRK
mgnify:CR=1 FL=1